MGRAGVVLAAALMQAALLVATALPPISPGLGVPVWHHNASLGVALLFVALTWKLHRDSRRFLGLGVAVTSLLAIVSGFLLLYLKADLKTWELKDWAKWWHIAWSWFALTFFMAHFWINRAPFMKFWRRLRRRRSGRVLHDGALLAVAAAVAATWSPLGARLIVESNYLLLTLYTWLVVAGPAYAGWALVRWRAAWATRPRSVPRWARGPAVQRGVDVALLPAAILANVSGFPLLYFDTKSTSLKYVAKYWHTWPSIAFTVLVFAHTLHSWRPLTTHWRRWLPGRA